jgi:hypothetical protein
MTFTVTRTSEIDVEGVDDPVEAARILAALSEYTVGQTMLFEGRPITYVKHVSTHAMRSKLFGSSQEQT